MRIREATEVDVPALERVKALGGAGHRDRIIHDADIPMRVLVAEEDGEIVGYAFLVLATLPFWTPRYAPQLVDLQVHEDRRDRGIGAALVRASEKCIREQGGTALFLAVDPDHNPRALALYRRLGFRPLATRPVDEPWRFTDSAGIEHSGVDHVIYLEKTLA